MKKFGFALIASTMVFAASAGAHETPTAQNASDSSTAKKSAATGGKATAPKPTEHSGGTDASGCHMNHSTGVYHCHNPK